MEVSEELRSLVHAPKNMMSIRLSTLIRQSLKNDDLFAKLLQLNSTIYSDFLFDNILLRSESHKIDPLVLLQFVERGVFYFENWENHLRFILHDLVNKKYRVNLPKPLERYISYSRRLD